MKSIYIIAFFLLCIFFSKETIAQYQQWHSQIEVVDNASSESQE